MTVLNPKSPQWYPELIHFCPDVPFILVGTKADIRNDPSEAQSVASGQIVQTEQGNELARKLKAVRYMECSAKTSLNLKDVVSFLSRCR